jgi:hypothetical protein
VPGIEEMVVAGQVDETAAAAAIVTSPAARAFGQKFFLAHSTIGAGNGTHCVGGADILPPQANGWRVRSKLRRGSMRIHIFVGAALIYAQWAADAQAQNYTVTSIVTNSKDKHLANPWGLSHLPKNHDELQSVVGGRQRQRLLHAVHGEAAHKTGLTIRIPSASGSGPGSPTGIANNPGAEEFAFATLDGTVSKWSAYSTPAKPGTGCYECHVSDATIVVNHWASGASYQGLTTATKGSSGALTYYVANASGAVEAYDATTFARVDLPADAFTDSMIPSTYTPAGIQAIGSKIFVTYNASAGGGTGYVDAFEPGRQAAAAARERLVQSTMGSRRFARQFRDLQRHDSGGQHGQRVDRRLRPDDRSFRGIPAERGIGSYAPRPLGDRVWRRRRTIRAHQCAVLQRRRGDPDHRGVRFDNGGVIGP